MMKVDEPLPVVPGNLAKSESLYRDCPPVLQCVQTLSATGRNVLRTRWFSGIECRKFLHKKSD